MSAPCRPTLLSIPYDVRIILYSHMELPPCTGFEQYTGLFLTCKDISLEVQKETKLRTKELMNSAEQQQSTENSAPEWKWKISSHEFQSFGLLRSVTVDLPFHIPIGYWYFMLYNFQFTDLTTMSSLERIRDTVAYSDQVEQQLDTLKPLFELYIENLVIKLEAGPQVVTHLKAGRNMIKRTLDHIQLSGTPLGMILRAYAAMFVCLYRDIVDSMSSVQEQWSVHNIILNWSFDHQPVNPDFGPRYYPENGVETRFSRSANQMNGAVMINMEKSTYLAQLQFTPVDVLRKETLKKLCLLRSPEFFLRV